MRGQDPIETLEGLRAQLNKSNEVFHKNNKRDGAYASLFYIIETLKELGFSDDQLHPLWALQSSLRDLDRGKQTEIVTPTKNAGRPPNSDVEVSMWANASALITLLKGQGQSIEESAGQVAKIFREREIPIPTNKKSNQSDWQCIVSWREAMLAGRKNELARTRYDQRLNMARSVGNNNMIDILLQYFKTGTRKTV